MTDRKVTQKPIKYSESDESGNEYNHSKKRKSSTEAKPSPSFKKPIKSNQIVETDEDEDDGNQMSISPTNQSTIPTNLNSPQSVTASKSNKNEPSSSTKKVTIKKEPKSAKKSIKNDKVSDGEPAKKVTVKKEKVTVKKEKVTVKKEKKEEAGDDEPEEGEEESEEYKWWKQQNADTSVKWTSLSHNGPYFPPPYEPHGVKMKYNGSFIELSPEIEEIVTFYAALIGTDWAENKTFQANFFNDMKKYAKDYKIPCPLLDFDKCDFTPITHYLAELKEKRKAMSKQEKQDIKDEKLKLEESHGWALLDNRKEKIGNFRIEPPGLFRGRGEHPKTGSLKTRVVPEQVTLNIGKDDPVPSPPPGHKWGEIIHDNSVTWLAYWKENVNDNFKYVFLAANSSLKGQSDFKKFEKARTLKDLVVSIRADYTIELKDKLMMTRQRATAMYLIDRLALRAGNEKGEEEADTVGCCSLRFEHISLEPPNKVIFDFLGKDSIRYYNEVTVDDQVFKNLKLFKKEPKKEGDPLFDRLNTGLLNKHLGKYMPGLTAKVFRTYNASFTFQNELNNSQECSTQAEKILAYNRANREVAVLCNHQRAVSKGHGSQMSKLQDKILAMKYDRQEIKKQMLILEPKLKSKRPELTEAESDVDEEFIERHLEALKEAERLKTDPNAIEEAKKKLEAKNLSKWETINVKRKSEGQEPMTLEEFRESDQWKKYVVPEKTDKKPRVMTMEQLESKLKTLTNRIETQKTSFIDKDENKATALGTSKTNYIDPRISVAWCAKNDVPLDKIFNKSLRDKFNWAMDVDAEWQF